MIPVIRPRAPHDANTKGRVAADNCLDRLADKTQPKTTLAKLRKLAQQRFAGLMQHRADLDALMDEWNDGFDSIIKEHADYVAAGGAAGTERSATFRRARRHADAVAAMLGAVTALPDAEQRQVLAACAKLAHDLNDELASLAGGAT